jgi:rod shape-determining protein MreC
MSYLLDKKIQRNKFFKIAIFVFFLLVLFYFRTGISNGFSYVAHGVFRPVLVLGTKIGEKMNNVGSYFVSKNSLNIQNEDLRAKLREDEAKMFNYNSIVAENESLKEIINRKNLKTSMMLAAILSKPNKSVYDTLIIDLGTEQGVKTGDLVFALGDVPIGHISEAYINSSKVVLFSAPSEKTQVVIKNKFLELVGRGGGNFEMILPRDFKLETGNQALLPGINDYVVAEAVTIISDPRNPFTKALLVSPINIQELKFVQVAQ